MGDFLSFRKMITPAVIQIVFWLGVLGCILMGLTVLSNADFIALTAPGIPPTLLAVLIMVLGPVLVRVYCELLMVLFRIYESLRNIELTRSSGGTS